MGLFDTLGSIAKGIGNEIKSSIEEYKNLLEKYEDEDDDRLYSKLKSGSMIEKNAAYKTLVNRHGKKEVKNHVQSEALIRQLDEQMRRM